MAGIECRDNYALADRGRHNHMKLNYFIYKPTRRSRRWLYNNDNEVKCDYSNLDQLEHSYLYCNESNISIVARYFFWPRRNWRVITDKPPGRKHALIYKRHKYRLFWHKHNFIFIWSMKYTYHFFKIFFT